jgi:hypothetical protein
VSGREVDHRPDGRLAAALVVLAAVVVAGPALWAWSVRDRLPAEVAAHWGTGGQVTRTEPLVTHLVTFGAIVALVVVAAGVPAVLARLPVAVRRMLAGCAAWTGTLLAAGQVGGLRGQLGLADGMAAPSPTAGLAVGALVGVPVAVAVAAAAREAPHRVPAASPPPADLPRVDGAGSGGEPPTFEASTHGSRGVRVAGVVAAAPLVLLAPVAGWWIAVVGVLVAALVLAGSRFTTRVDDDGLTVRAAGWTMVTVPVAEVAEARVVEVDPFWEFGGWGLRVDVHGRTGVVARPGEAVEVLRGDGSRVVVTVDDATTAAGALNTRADALHDGR